MSPAKIVAENKEGLVLAWRVVWQVSVVTIPFLLGYAVMFGSTLWTDQEQVDTSIENKLNSKVFPRLQIVEIHAADPNLHFGFNERGQFPTRADLLRLENELRRLNDRLDRTAQ